VTAQGMPLPLDAAFFSFLSTLQDVAASASHLLLGIYHSLPDPSGVRMSSGWHPSRFTQSWRLSSMVERLVSLRAGPWFDSTSSQSDCAGFCLSRDMRKSSPLLATHACRSRVCPDMTPHSVSRHPVNGPHTILELLAHSGLAVMANPVPPLCNPGIPAVLCSRSKNGTSQGGVCRG